MAGPLKISSLRVTLDDTQYTQAAKGVVAVNEQMAQSANPLVQQLASVDQAAQRSSASLERIKRAADPAYASSSRLATSAATLRAQVAAGNVTLEEAAKLYDQLRAKQDATSESARAAAQAEMALQRSIADARAAQTAASAQTAINGVLGVGAAGAGSAAASAAVFEEQFAAQAAQAAQMERLSQEAQGLRDKLDPLSAVERRYGDAVSHVNELIAAGALAETEGAAAISLAAAARDVEVAAIEEASKSHAGLFSWLGRNRMAAQELEHSARAMADGLAAGANPIRILSMEGARLAQALGMAGISGEVLVMGAAVAGSVGAIVGVAAAINAWHDHLLTLDATMATSGRNAGLTRDQYIAFSTSVSDAGQMSVHAGQQIVTALVDSGEGARALALAAPLARDFGASLGVSGAEGAKKLAEALKDPVRGLDELEQQFGPTDAGLKVLIEDMVAQGRTADAQVLILQKYGPAIKSWDTAAKGSTLDSFFHRLGNSIEGVLHPIEAVEAALSRLHPPANIGPNAADEATQRNRTLVAHAPDLAESYDPTTQKARALTNEMNKLRETMIAIPAAARATSPVYQQLQRDWDADSTALNSFRSAHTAALDDIHARSAALASPEALRGMSEQIAELRQQEQNELSKGITDRGGRSDDQVRAEYEAKIALATRETTVAIGDQIATMNRRTEAQLSYADALRTGGLEGGAAAQMHSAGADAAATGRDSASGAATRAGQEAAAQGYAGATQAVVALQREVALLGTTQRTTTMEEQAYARQKEADDRFDLALAEARAAGMSDVVAKLQAEKSAYLDLAAARDSAQNSTDLARQIAEQQDDLSIAQERLRMQTQLNSSKADEAVPAARMLATDQERLELQREGYDLTSAQAQKLIQLAGDTAAVAEQQKLLNQEIKNGSKLWGDVGKSISDALTDLADPSKSMKDKMKDIRGIGTDLAKTLTKDTIVDPLLADLGLTNGKNSGTSLFGGLFGGDSNSSGSGDANASGSSGLFGWVSHLFGGGSDTPGAGAGGAAGMLGHALGGATSVGSMMVTAGSVTVSGGMPGLPGAPGGSPGGIPGLGNLLPGGSGSSVPGAGPLGLLGHLFGSDVPGSSESGLFTANGLFGQAGWLANLFGPGNAPSDFLGDYSPGLDMQGFSDADIADTGAFDMPGFSFADGGSPPVGVPSLVGENGPELFVPTMSGSIVPNGQFGGSSSYVGGDNHYHAHFHGDVGGDPAQVHKAVTEALQKAGPVWMKQTHDKAVNTVYAQMGRGGTASKMSGRRPLGG